MKQFVQDKKNCGIRKKFARAQITAGGINGKWVKVKRISGKGKGIERG